MKRVALVASNKEYAKVLKNNLNIYFLKFIEINIYDINDVDNFNYFREKYIILSSYTIFQRVKNKVKKEAKLSIITLSLTKKGFDMIKNIPYNTKALLVNIDYRSCMQLITEIFSLGIHHLDLVPYYKFGSDYNKDINIAVTPDEENIVPEDINTVINIGQRVISFNSIIEIGMNLGIKDIINSKEIIKLKKVLLQQTTAYKQ